MLDEKTRAQLIGVAHEMADAARIETLRYFRTPALEAANKDKIGGFDPVTEGDRAAERAMRAVLERLRPDDGILGEEFGLKDGNSGLTWVLDPIDGTRAYISGTASWGVLISLEDENGPIFGIIDQPYIGERFIGGFGMAELLGPKGARHLKCRSKVTLKDATLMTTYPEVGTEVERHAFERVRDHVKLTRYGLDCYAYALVALGQVDCVIEAGLSAYDISAPIAVIEAAGGIATDWQGGKAHRGGQVVACGDAQIHAEILKILNR